MLAKIIAKSTAVKLHFEFCVSSNTNILINTGISFQRRKDNAIKCYLPLQSGEGCVILLMIGEILVCAITYGAAKDGKYSYLFCLGMSLGLCAFYTAIHLLVVDVECVLFWT